MIKDVHTQHCCIVHGCKYFSDHCTVLNHPKLQEYLCEDCELEGMVCIEDLKEKYPDKFGLKITKFDDSYTEREKILIKFVEKIKNGIFDSFGDVFWAANKLNYK